MKNNLKMIQNQIEEMLEEPVELNAASYFYDIGGNSLLAMEFLSFLEENFQLTLNVKDLFEKSIFEIAALTEKSFV